MYVFWGSTYLGIRVAVDHVPPILMAGARFTIAGSLLLLFCALTGRRIALGRGPLLKVGFIGFLLLGVCNVILAWAELYVPTGLAALLVAVVPIWFLLVERFLLPTGHRVGGAGLAGVALGLAGMVVLLWPKLAVSHALGVRELVAALSLLVSSFLWAFGSVLGRRWHVNADPLVASAWQMTVAGCIDTVVGLSLGQHLRASWNATGILAILYLVVFGSWVGYSAYVWLLRHVPTAKVATYAYVNPIVAVFLGWLFLDESVDRYIVSGAAIIVAAVTLVTRAEAPAARGVEVGEHG